MKNIIISLCLFLMSATTIAGQVSGVITVSINVVDVCAITSIQNLVLPTYSSAASVTEALPIRMQCTLGTPARVYIDNHPMTGPGGQTLNYEIVDSHNNPIGAQGIAVVGEGHQSFSVPLSAQVPAGQKVKPGLYSDTSIVRIVF